MACAATNNAHFRGAIEKGSLSGVISRQGSVIEKIEKGGLKGSNFLEGLKGGNWEQNHINREKELDPRSGQDPRLGQDPRFLRDSLETP